MKFPPLNNNDSKLNKEEAKDSLKLPEIDRIDINEDKEKFKGHFNEFRNENEEIEVDRKGQYKHDELKKSYESIMSMFNKEEKDSDKLLEQYEKEIKEQGLYTLKNLEEAIESRNFDLSKYDVFTMNRLLSRLEKADLPASLESYNIKNIDEFYKHITSGKLDVSKYKTSEIDKLVDGLIEEND